MTLADFVKANVDDDYNKKMGNTDIFVVFIGNNETPYYSENCVPSSLDGDLIEIESSSKQYYEERTKGYLSARKTVYKIHGKVVG